MYYPALWRGGNGQDEPLPGDGKERGAERKEGDLHRDRGPFDREAEADAFASDMARSREYRKQTSEEMKSE